MKWCEVERPRVSLLQGRRYPPIAAKNRRRHTVDQEAKDGPAAMHHQFHVGYNGVQGGTRLNARNCTLRVTATLAVRHGTVKFKLSIFAHGYFRRGPVGLSLFLSL